MDWLASALTLLSVLLLTRHRRFGWVVGMVGNCVWIVWGGFQDSLAVCCLNFVFLFVNWYGYLHWK